MSLSAAQVDRANRTMGSFTSRQRVGRPFAHFAVGILSGEFSQIVPVRRRKRDRAQEREDIDVSFGDKANQIDKFEHMHHKYGWWSPALVTLAGDESEDVIAGSRAGIGADAWRKFVKRWDVVVDGRNRALFESDHHSATLQTLKVEREDRKVRLKRSATARNGRASKADN